MSHTTTTTDKPLTVKDIRDLHIKAVKQLGYRTSYVDLNSIPPIPKANNKFIGSITFSKI